MQVKRRQLSSTQMIAPFAVPSRFIDAAFHFAAKYCMVQARRINQIWECIRWILSGWRMVRFVFAPACCKSKSMLTKRGCGLEGYGGTKTDATERERERERQREWACGAERPNKEWLSRGCCRRLERSPDACAGGATNISPCDVARGLCLCTSAAHGAAAKTQNPCFCFVFSICLPILHCAVFLLFAFAPGRAFQVKSIHSYSILLAGGLLELWGYPWVIYD